MWIFGMLFIRFSFSNSMLFLLHDNLRNIISDTDNKATYTYEYTYRHNYIELHWNIMILSHM